MTAITLDQQDAGIVIEATLTFGEGFDPAGATAILDVAGDAPRPMTLAGAVASYTVQAGEFRVGFNRARIHVAKPPLRLSSEPFLIIV